MLIRKWALWHLLQAVQRLSVPDSDSDWCSIALTWIFHVNCRAICSGSTEELATCLQSLSILLEVFVHNSFSFLYNSCLFHSDTQFSKICILLRPCLLPTTTESTDLLPSSMPRDQNNFWSCWLIRKKILWPSELIELITCDPVTCKALLSWKIILLGECWVLRLTMAL